MASTLGNLKLALKEFYSLGHYNLQGQHPLFPNMRREARAYRPQRVKTLHSFFLPYMTDIDFLSSGA